MKLAFRYWYLSIFLLFSTVSYLSVLVPPLVFWPAVFLCFVVPVFFVLNACLFILFVIRWRKLILFPFLGMIGGLPFLMITIAQNSNDTREQSDFSVLSFNAKLFRKQNTYGEFSMEMIKWVVEDTSAIKCIQEYSTDNRWEPLDVTHQMAERGYQSFALQSKKKDNDHNPGLAIFTKFKLLNSGVVWEDPNTLNGAIFVDVIVRGDTLRVYNVHLGSMALRMYQLREPENYFHKLRTMIAKLRDGAGRRSMQIDSIIEHTKSSPYPYLICGDFNEIPYSYNYFKLRSKFANSFEKAGRGFGFSP